MEILVYRGAIHWEQSSRFDRHLRKSLWNSKLRFQSGLQRNRLIHKILTSTAIHLENSRNFAHFNEAGAYTKFVDEASGRAEVRQHPG